MELPEIGVHALCRVHTCVPRPVVDTFALPLDVHSSVKFEPLPLNWQADTASKSWHRWTRDPTSHEYVVL
jgi:hypothetical protein